MNYLVSHSFTHLRRSTTQPFRCAATPTAIVRTLATTTTPSTDPDKKDVVAKVPKSRPAKIPTTPSNDLFKKDLAANVAVAYGLPHSKSEKIVTTIFDSIVESVSDGKAVKLSGFGTFETYASKAKNGVNPATRESIVIPSHRRIRFKAFKSFKEIVDPSFKKAPIA